VNFWHFPFLSRPSWTRTLAGVMAHIDFAGVAELNLPKRVDDDWLCVRQFIASIREAFAIHFIYISTKLKNTNTHSFDLTFNLSM
jgi:hypothetical protein